MNQEIRVLVVESRKDPLSVVDVLQTEGWRSQLAGSIPEADDSLSKEQPDAILLDLGVGMSSAMDFLRRVNEAYAVIPVVVTASDASIEMVAEALRSGAFDFLARPFENDRIVHVLKRAMDAKRRRVGRTSRETSGNAIPIIGQSLPMIEVYKAMVRVSNTDSTVLITGESGTGKELAARAIHRFSCRSEKPFVAVNCGAVTETLLESELFGHRKGSFSGAVQDHQGIFETASGGTVFLDEIGETSPAFQVKLLRVLQERAIKPVGSAREKAVDVRIISATNHSLESLTSSSFRKDLLYRLSVIHIPIPPLRERGEDISLLAKRFLRIFNRRQKKRVVLLPATLEWMKAQPWPGNVRELENAIERAVTMNVSGEIHPEDLARPDFRSANETLSAGLPPDRNAGSATIAALPADDSLKSLDDMAKDHILKVLNRTGGSKSRTAKVLGIARPSLYRMAKRFGIDLDKFSYEAKKKLKDKAP